MASVLDAFTQITQLLADVQPKINLIKDPDNDLFIEVHPMANGKGGIYATVLGPFPDEEAADKYLVAKYHRNKVRAASHFSNGGPIEHDGMAICHPNFKYRIIAAQELLARYLAQIGVTLMGGMVEITRQPETQQEYRPLEIDDEPDPQASE